MIARDARSWRARRVPTESTVAVATGSVAAMSIVPDDKDWTWVLTRPCDECGFDPREVDVECISDAVEAMGERWVRVLASEDVSRRPSQDRWSPLEYGCHVRDVFRLFDHRLDLMIAEDGATFENWDQDRTAVEDRYDLQDPSVVSAELLEAARDLAARFASVSGAQWEHRGLRSNGSEFTVRTFAVYLAHDPYHHLADVGVEPAHLRELLGSPRV